MFARSAFTLAALAIRLFKVALQHSLIGLNRRVNRTLQETIVWARDSARRASAAAFACLFLQVELDRCRHVDQVFTRSSASRRDRRQLFHATRKASEPLDIAFTPDNATNARMRCLSAANGSAIQDQPTPQGLARLQSCEPQPHYHPARLFRWPMVSLAPSPSMIARSEPSRLATSASPPSGMGIVSLSMIAPTLVRSISRWSFRSVAGVDFPFVVLF